MESIYIAVDKKGLKVELKYVQHKLKSDSIMVIKIVLISVFTLVMIK